MKTVIQSRFDNFWTNENTKHAKYTVFTTFVIKKKSLLNIMNITILLIYYYITNITK